MNGKTAMVWKLRDWQGGEPAAQVAQCRDLGLSEVQLKIVDGRYEKWERSYVKRQNCELLPDTIAALKEAGIRVAAWGWTYGTFVEQEVDKTIELCRRFGIEEYWIDAEDHYRKPGMLTMAKRYSQRFAQQAPDIFLTLCTYRFPKKYQPDFPIDGFTPYMDGWCPQVYWLLDNRTDGGAIQTKISYEHYMDIRALPYMLVAPTYPHNTSGGPWYATGEQIRLAFEAAKAIGCAGVSVWDLPQATQDQLKAIREFVWEEEEPEEEQQPEQPPVPDYLPAEIALRMDEIKAGIEDEASILKTIASAVGVLADRIRRD